MTCLLPAPHTIHPLPPSLHYQPPTIHTPTSLLLPLPSLSSLLFSALSVRIGWAVWDSMPNRWALCVLAQTQSMVRDGKWRGREKERDRVGEKEGEKRSCTRVCQRSCTVFQHWFGPLVFVFFSLLLLCPHPPCPALSLPLRESYADQNWTNSTRCFASHFFFFFVFHQDIFSACFCKQRKKLVLIFDNFIILLHYLFYFICAHPAPFFHPFRHRDC